MNKWQIICPLTALVIFAAIIGISAGAKNRRHFLTAQTRMIGRDLIRTTNSTGLTQISPQLQRRLLEILGSPTEVMAVELGDGKPPIGDGSACSRLILSNASGECLGIRLGPDSLSHKYQVLGYWNMSERNAVPK